MPRTWEIDLTDTATRWLRQLPERDRDRMVAALSILGERGPGLGRPTVDSIKGSRHHNMKELRSPGGNLRALFAFDPRRHAVVLIGGDKSGQWRAWYERNIPVADRLLGEHLRALGGGETWQPPRSGRHSEPRSR